MSVIAVTGFAFRSNLKFVVRVLARAINGHFEALNFENKASKKNTKKCYIRLSDKLDPVRVIEKINSSTFPKQMRLFATIPEHVPDIPLANKPVKVPLSLRRALHIPDEDPPQQVLTIIHKEIMVELLCKYQKLHSLSLKNKHQLLEQIGRTIFERLKDIYERGSDPCQSAFQLSKCYRRTHPHFGDFQLVLTTLHSIEDAAGSPRTQITEAELVGTSDNLSTVENLPRDKILALSKKYTDTVIKRLVDHILTLDAAIRTNDTEEVIARKKVREELKKIEPYLPEIVKQVMQKNFASTKTVFSKLRVYGEPFMPSKAMMSPFLKRYKAFIVKRSRRMYNLLMFNIPPNQLASIKAMDGTVINGAKLVIRSSDMPEYKQSMELRTEMAALFGGTPQELLPEDLGEPMDLEQEDQEEQEWSELWDEQNMATA